MTGEFRGKCPVCSAQLDEYVPNLRCREHPEHFAIRKDVFERAWGLYEGGKRTLTEGEALLSALLVRNTAEQKPDIKSVWQIIKEDVKNVQPEPEVDAIVKDAAVDGQTAGPMFKEGIDRVHNSSKRADSYIGEEVPGAGE